MAKFVRKQRKHKSVGRSAGHDEKQNSNVEVIHPAAPKHEAKAIEKRTTPAVSGKKAKRLEKYLQAKLEKDEVRELLEKLSANRIDTSVFESIRHLGQAKPPKRDPAIALPRTSSPSRKEPVTLASLERQSSDDAKDTSPSRHHSPPRVGSGLKRPLAVDDDARPIIQKRRKRGGVRSKFQSQSLVSRGEGSGIASGEDDEEGSQEDTDHDVEGGGEEWNGFPDSSSELSADGGREGSHDDTDDGTGDSGTDETDDSEDNSEDEASAPTSNFKAWAHGARNAALGYQPSAPVVNSTALEIPKPENFEARPLEQDPLPLELEPTARVDRKAHAVIIQTPSEIQEARLALPIVAEEQKIMEAIHNFDVVIISGATGSGKTTQVPRFLYEAGYGSPDSPTPGMIGVTQPRRIAAVSMSKRVAEEMGDHGHVVGYQIRFQRTTTQKTAIKFMTDGVLLREVAEDFPLRKYSAIVVDEAHERSVNTDLLLGILSRVNKAREELREEVPSLEPLKLIIMSATLRIEEITNNAKLFPTPPRIVEAEGRQYPVTVHFARKTSWNYVEEAFQKIVKGHRKLPPGGFLVFLTGQNEIHELSRRLRLEINGAATARPPRVQISASEAPYEVEDVDFGEAEFRDDYDDDYDDGASSGDEDDAAEFAIEDEESGTGPRRVNVLPLYSLLSTKEQQKVFEPPPEGSRQIILATNVAETSLTIPGVRYVFDCGRSKARKYDPVSGVQKFEVGWISKASANQRSGRAGRTEPGHCYRLYSSAVYERDFDAFTQPEIVQTPVDGVVLQLKAMGVPSVAAFPFPTPPEQQSLIRAEKVLKYIRALEPNGSVSDWGSLMSIFPLPPRFSRILLLANKGGCIHYAIALVAGLSAREVFIPLPEVVRDVGDREERAAIEKAYKKFHWDCCVLDEYSDAMKLLKLVGEFIHEPSEAWCRDHFVRYRALAEVQQLRRQITALLKSNIPAFANLTFQDTLGRPTDKQVDLLKQMVVAGFIDHVAIRADKLPQPPDVHVASGRAIDQPYMPLSPVDAADAADRLVFLHPSSPLAHLSKSELPDYVVYSHLHQRAESGAKTRMHALTDVSASRLAALAQGSPLLSYSKPIKEVIESPYALERVVWVQPYLKADGAAGGARWELPVSVKLREKKVPGKGWVVQ